MTKDFQSESGIFSWDQIERFEFEHEGNQTQIISGNNMHLLRAVFEPGAVYPMHSHPHEQFSVLLSGRILLTVGEEVREIGAGDGWYAGCHVPHGGKILGDEPAVFIDVYSPARDIVRNGPRCVVSRHLLKYQMCILRSCEITAHLMLLLIFLAQT